MEDKELVFSSIETLTFPMLLVNKNDEKYMKLYANIAMKELLPELDIQEVDESLFELLQKYEEQENKNSYVLYDIEIYDSFFNLYFTQSSEGVGIIFIQTPATDVLNSLTFRELSESCSAITIVLDENGNIFDANNCFLDLVDLTIEDVLNKSFFQTFIPGDIEQLGTYFQNILSEESHHQHFMTPLKAKGGELYRISWQVSKIVKQSQTYIIAIGSDVSRLFKENRNLKQQLSSVEVGFEYFPFSVGYMNVEGTFIKMNAHFMKMFGITDSNVKISFDSIALFKNNIGFNYLEQHIKFVKDMKQIIDYKDTKLRVSIRVIKGKKESSKFYIVVVQKER